MRRRTAALMAVVGVVGAAGLVVPGAAQAATAPSMFDCLAYEPTLMVGTDQTACTAAWQGYLSQTIDPDMSIDGQFGPATEKATREFQSEFNATEDGVVGGETWGWIGYSCDTLTDICSKQFSY